jgi:hypothetical protein
VVRASGSESAEVLKGSDHFRTSRDNCTLKAWVVLSSVP